MNGITNTWTYAEDGRVLSIAGSDGRNRTYTYDLRSPPNTVTEEFSGPDFSYLTVFTLGKHGLAVSDDEGNSYEYDVHGYLVRVVRPSLTETRTIVDGNLGIDIITGSLSETIIYTYTSLENCPDSGIYFLGKRFRNWPETATIIKDGQLAFMITYSYELDVNGRVATRTTTISSNAGTRTQVTAYLYE